MSESQGLILTCVLGGILFLWRLIQENTHQRQELLLRLPADVRPAAQSWSEELIEAHLAGLLTMDQIQVIMEQKWSKELIEAHLEGTLTLDQIQAIRERKLPVGMPPTGVRMVWGAPHDVDQSAGVRGNITVWTWWESGPRGRRKIDKRVTFHEGRLVKWEDK